MNRRLSQISLSILVENIRAVQYVISFIKVDIFYDDKRTCLHSFHKSESGKQPTKEYMKI